jgi:hypothetical protein
MAVDVRLVASILCLATDAEIEAINDMLAQSCGKVITVVPAGEFPSSDSVKTLDTGNPTLPPQGPGNPPPKPPIG